MAVAKFRTVLADPPWPEQGGGKCKRGADRHYPLLSPVEIVQTIAECPEYQQVDETAHCYLWVTNNYLPKGLWVLEQLGWRYITCITWVKDKIGLGQYFRGQTEQLLFAVRGEYQPAKQQGTTWLYAPRTMHSRKPIAAYTLIERVSPAPYLELFARQARTDWMSWGNEVQRQEDAT